MDKEKLLEVNNLRVEYSDEDEIVSAVNGISFSVDKGETLGLVGETGAGKTTTALSIMGLIPVPPGRITDGEILYKGDNLLLKSEKQMRQIRGKEIAMIFQDPMTSLNPVISIGDQITEAIQLHDKSSKLQAASKAKEMLELVGIPSERYGEYPHQFSGGMKQRVIIAMALACNPQVLIADEPTTALDVTIQAQVLKMIKDLKEKYEMAMILITHDMGIVAETCNSVAIMYSGEIIEWGKIRGIFENTKHPYTEGLFKSIPDLEAPVGRLETIKGLVSDPTDLPEGCKFHPRCKYCMEICSLKEPPAVEVEPDHYVRCWKYGGSK